MRKWLYVLDNLTSCSLYSTLDLMKMMPVGEFKAHFSEAVEQVKRGEEIVISYGKKREKVAVLVPYATYKRKNKVTLGVLRDEASVEFADDFEMSPEELIQSLNKCTVMMREVDFCRFLAGIPQFSRFRPCTPRLIFLSFDILEQRSQISRSIK